MVVTCKRCAASFQVDASKLGPEGSNVKCGKCGLVFYAKPDSDAPPSTEESKVVSSLADQLLMFSGTAPDAADDSPLILEPLVPVQLSPEPAPVPPTEKTPFPKAAPPKAPLPKAPPPKAPPPRTPASKAPPTKAPAPKAPPPKEKTDPAPDKSTKPTRVTPLPLLRRPDTLHPRQLAGRPIPLKQRLAHSSFVALIMLLGVLFGLVAMQVKPLPKDLYLLVKYGKRSLPREVQILEYQGRIQEISPTERLLLITGEIFNNSSENVPAPALRLEVFSPGGEFLLKKSFPCCSDRLGDGDMVPFSTQLDLGPTASVGSYKVSLEK